MIRELLTRNIGLKLIALALAISLELYFMSPSNMSTASLQVPVELLNIPSNMVTVAPMVGDRGLSAEVRIRGPAPLIESAARAPHRFLVRIPEGNSAPDSLNRSQRNFSLPLSVDQLDLASGIDVIELNPRVIEVRLEPTLRKEVPVTVLTEGDVADGYEIADVDVTPDAIAIWGPESEIDPVTDVSTEPVNVQGLDGARSEEVPLVEFGEFSHLEFSRVRVSVNAIPKLAERNFEGVRVQIRAPQGIASTMDVSKVKVTIAAPEFEIKSYVEREVVVFASLEGVGAGTHEVKLQTELPTGARLVKLTPEKVRVTVIEGRQNGRGSAGTSN